MRRTEITDGWLEALRSGEYEQGRGLLRLDTANGTTYCCLGVVAQLLNRLVPNDIVGYNETQWWFTPDRVRTSTLDRETADLAGLTEDEQEALVYLNDEAKFTFAQIADAIERDLAGGEPIIHLQQRR